MGKLPDSVWGTPDWGEPAVTVAAKEPAAEPVPVEVVVAETQRLLESPGWCLWRCSALTNDVVVIVRDELVTGYPIGYPVYMVQELIEFTEIGEGMIRMAHEAKKYLGAKVLAVGKLPGREDR